MPTDLFADVLVETHGPVTVVRFTRRTVLDPRAIEAINDRLRSLVRDEGRRILLLDFAPVEGLPTALLGTFVRLFQALQALDGRLAFCRVGPFLKQIMQLCNLPAQIVTYASEEEALAALAPPPSS